MSNRIPFSTLALLLAMVPAHLFSQINNPNRFVQFTSIDFETSVVELHNFGTTDQDLSGWRFCSHDESEVKRYSGFFGLDGTTVAAGESLFIHFANDASEANELNIDDIGGSFALPLDTDGAYSIQIYFQTPFGNGDNIADHVQFSLFGIDDTSADDRSDEAESGGVWTDQTAWTPVLPESLRLVLSAGAEEFELNEPADYVNEFPFVLGDINQDETVDLFDVAGFVVAITGGENVPAADINLDGSTDLFDVSPFVSLLTGP